LVCVLSSLFVTVTGFRAGAYDEKLRQAF